MNKIRIDESDKDDFETIEKLLIQEVYYGVGESTSPVSFWKLSAHSLSR